MSHPGKWQDLPTPDISKQCLKPSTFPSVRCQNGNSETCCEHGLRSINGLVERTVPRIFHAARVFQYDLAE